MMTAKQIYAETEELYSNLPAFSIIDSLRTELGHLVNLEREEIREKQAATVEALATILYQRLDRIAALVDMESGR